MNDKPIWINYTNYRGETSDRLIVTRELFFGSNEWHPDPQWLLRAFDVEKQAERTFAMKDVHRWDVPITSSPSSS